MRVLKVHADVAVVSVEGECGKAIGGGCLALVFRGFCLLEQCGKVFTIGVGLANCGVDIELIEGRVGRMVGEIERLRKRQADGAREGQLVFFESIFGDASGQDGASGAPG